MEMLSSEATLLWIDMQPEIVQSSITMSGAELSRRAGLLREAATMLALPVLATGVPLGPGHTPTLIEELGDLPLAVRATISALDDEAIAEKIANDGRRVLLLGGVSVEIGILHTALTARKKGMEVHLLVDVCGGLSERTEHSALQQMQAAGVILSNVSSALSGLTPSLRSEAGQVVMQTIAKIWRWS